MKAGDYFSNLVRDFKKGNPDAYDKVFSHLVPEVLNLKFPASVVVCVMPSCSGEIKPMQKLAAEVAEFCDLIDGTELLRKLHVTPSFCRTGKRDYSELWYSIEADPIVNGRHILLLDDVTTTGTSFAAASARLFEAGAASVTCLAIARTVLLLEVEAYA
jgi:predicted amidophosphoribosyltransferase